MFGCRFWIFKKATGPELFFSLLAQICRNAVKSFRDAACDRGERIAVTADGDRAADRILKGNRFEERFDRLRDRALTGLVELVGRTDIIKRKVQRVLVLFDECADLFPAVSGPCKEDGARRCFRAFDAFRMVVRDDRDSA